jgi:lipopolysaccharide export system permease protein
MVRVLNRYIFREVAQVWVAVTGVLLVILLSNQLARVLSLAATNQLQGDTILVLLGLSSLQYLPVLFPIGLFFAIMLALGRLYHESEMAAIQSGGIGVAGLYKPIIVLMALIVIALTWLCLFMVPQAASKGREIRNEAIKQAQFSSFEPGHFRSFPGGNLVFYAESVDASGALHNVFVERTVGEKLEIVQAARAEQRGAGQPEQTFILYDGERYEGIPGKGDFRIYRFAEHGIPIKLPSTGGGSIREEMKPTRQLIGSQDLSERAELEWRISPPIMALVLTLIGVPLAKLRPRQGRYGKMGMAILIYFVYVNLLAAARVWIERGTMPVEIGLWWVHAIFAVIGIYLLARQGVFGARTPRVMEVA